jgi:hypothetical protein
MVELVTTGGGTLRARGVLVLDASADVGSAVRSALA